MSVLDEGYSRNSSYALSKQCNHLIYVKIYLIITQSSGIWGFTTGCRGHDCMIVGLPIIYAICAYCY